MQSYMYNKKNKAYKGWRLENYQGHYFLILHNFNLKIAYATFSSSRIFLLF